MAEPRLFRVLEYSSEIIKLNPILEKEGRFVDDEVGAIDIETAGIDPSLKKTVQLLDPGHVVRAEVNETNGTHNLDSIEHRGGFTLVELNSRTVPYIISEYWGHEETRNKEQFSEDSFAIPIEQLAKDAEGELFVQSTPTLYDESWKSFSQGEGAESVYGGFHTTSGKPVEVFIGNPNGERYWYALLFVEEGSKIAREIRAQYGYLYDDYYIPNYAWDFSELIDNEKLPNDPDSNPKSVFRPEYTIHSNLIPDRFGSSTIDLLAEFVYVGSQFDYSMLGSSPDDLDDSNPFNHKPEDISGQSNSIINIYNFYTSLVLRIFDCIQDYPDKEIQELVEDDILPDPELLYRVHTSFTSSIHEIESYLEKMEQVPIEKYVVSRLQGGLEPEVQETMDELNMGDFPITIRYLLHVWGILLEEIREVLKLTPYVADVKETQSGLTYDVQANRKAYDFINGHQDTVSNNITPVDLGGEDPAVFISLLGRLQQRHNWLTTSTMGPMGEIFDGFGEDLE